MKPDWKDAPEWANYLAMDDDGQWIWHEEKPKKEINCWRSYGRYRNYGRPIEWWASLQEKPE